MLYEVKFGLIGFAVGTAAISASTLASSTSSPVHTPAAVVQQTWVAPAALPAPSPKPVALAAATPTKTQPDAAPMSAWRRAYIARYDHQPPAPAA